MNRGDRREPIFRDDEDRQKFLATLGEACVKTACLCVPHADRVGRPACRQAGAGPLLDGKSPACAEHGRQVFIGLWKRPRPTWLLE